jgi:hypothetical protein
MPVPVFTAGETLDASEMNAVGLWRVTNCTVTSAGGTAATASNGVITIGTGNTSVTVVNAFSASYDNYKIVISGGVASNSVAMTLQLGGSTTGYYGSLNYNLYTTSTPVAAGVNNAASFSYAGVGTANNLYMNLDLFLPFASKKTGLAAQYIQHSTGASAGGTFGGFHDVASSYTDFTIATAGNTMTGGTIRVYGYRN